MLDGFVDGPGVAEVGGKEPEEVSELGLVEDDGEGLSHGGAPPPGQVSFGVEGEVVDGV